jgi:hypothetical protein
MAMERRVKKARGESNYLEDRRSASRNVKEVRKRTSPTEGVVLVVTEV